MRKTFQVFMWKGRVKLLEDLFKILLLLMFLQLSQCCILNELVDTEFLMQVSFLLSQFDRSVFVESLITQD